MRRAWVVVGLVGLLAGATAPREVRGQGASAPPVRVGGGVQAPKRIKSVIPVYPPDARRERISGIVILEVTIGADGRVTDARVIRSIPELDQAAVDAVRQWEFTPTLLNGVPTPVLMTVTVNFTLDGQAQTAPAQPVAPDATRPGSLAGGQPGREARCAPDPAESPEAEAARRQAAVAFVGEVNFRERLAAIEVQSKGYLPLSELRGLPQLPDGFDVQLTLQSATYSVSVVDTRDACGFGVFSNQRGVVYVGSPVR